MEGDSGTRGGKTTTTTRNTTNTTDPASKRMNVEETKAGPTADANVGPTTTGFPHKSGGWSGSMGEVGSGSGGSGSGSAGSSGGTEDSDYSSLVNSHVASSSILSKASTPGPLLLTPAQPPLQPQPKQSQLKKAKATAPTSDYMPLPRQMEVRSYRPPDLGDENQGIKKPTTPVTEQTISSLKTAREETSQPPSKEAAKNKEELVYPPATDVFGFCGGNLALSISSILLCIASLTLLALGGGVCEAIDWQAWNPNTQTTTLSTPVTGPLFYNTSLFGFMCNGTTKGISTWTAESSRLAAFAAHLRQANATNDSALLDKAIEELVGTGMWLKVQLALFLLLAIVLLRSCAVLAFQLVAGLVLTNAEERGNLLLQFTTQMFLWSGVGVGIASVVWVGLEFYLAQFGYHQQEYVCKAVKAAGMVAADAMHCSSLSNLGVRTWRVGMFLGWLGAYCALCEGLGWLGIRFREEKRRQTLPQPRSTLVHTHKPRPLPASASSPGTIYIRVGSSRTSASSPSDVTSRHRRSTPLSAPLSAAPVSFASSPAQ